MKSLVELIRPNILSLEPGDCCCNERCGREARVLLDANENPYNKPFNRYPDALQSEVKKRMAVVKGVRAEQIFLSNGLDEAVDMVYRCFVNPQKDNVVAIAPTYGMYKFCADINNVEYRPVLLDDDFQVTAVKLLNACDANTKIIWLCSPNNPTGNNIHRKEIEKTLDAFDGIVVVDETYSDFSQETPFRTELDKYPNLIVLNTFSNAWGAASIQLGMAFAQCEIIDIFNKVKYPYNVNSLVQSKALDLLEDPYEVDNWVRMLLLERGRMIDAFKMLPSCKKVYPTNSNFFLAEMTDAQGIFDYLLRRGIAVRNCTDAVLCKNCLRITVGAKSENNELLAALRQ